MKHHKVFLSYTNKLPVRPWSRDLKLPEDIPQTVGPKPRKWTHPRRPGSSSAPTWHPCTLPTPHETPLWPHPWTAAAPGSQNKSPGGHGQSSSFDPRWNQRLTRTRWDLGKRPEICNKIIFYTIIPCNSEERRWHMGHKNHCGDYIFLEEKL